MLKNCNFFKKKLTKLNVIPVVYLYNSGKIDRYFNTKKTGGKYTGNRYSTIP